MVQQLNPKKRSSHHVDSHAIVIGGSIAGLLSARVLADYFSSVTIIEKDKLPASPNARKGVPQSVQPHILFAKGYRIVKELFPTIETKLIENGALKIDWVREFYHFGEAGWSINVKNPLEINSSEVVSFTCSRPLLEWAIRQQLCELPNIRIVEEYRVTGLVGDSSKKNVIGVYLQNIGSNIEDKLFASIIVDASGRSSQAPKWLENLGVIPPFETSVNPRLGYATRYYREPEGFQADWKVMLISQVPPNKTRLGYLARIEKGEWIATLGGYSGDFPPTDNEGFREFARSLPSSKFYQTISQAEPISSIYAYRATANRLRHFDRVAALPQGFIALGDAVCALCPVYGQGMTVSAIAAMVLQDWLRKSPRPFRGETLTASQFQKNLAQQIDFPWTLATTQDLRFPSTQGERPVGGYTSGLAKLMQWYTKQLSIKTTSDPSLHRLYLEVAHLLKSPLALYHPSVFFQVILN